MKENCTKQDSNQHMHLAHFGRRYLDSSIVVAFEFGWVQFCLQVNYEVKLKMCVILGFLCSLAGF